ncbi:MAG: hypothetical protein KAI25_05585, partial [Hyphomicrobiaceae bacterium]|nr:hypothetical protein [Hyphomicrobiaceae bacterium]
TYPNGTLLQQLANQATDFVFEPANLTALGRYNITVFANDTTGNTNTSTSYFYVNDTIAPTINISVNDTDVEYGVESVLIDFNASNGLLDSVIANVTYPNGTLLQQLTDQSVDFTFVPENLTSLGRYNITVFANDTSGNTNNSISYFYVNDTIYPAINISVNDTDVIYGVESVKIDFNASDANLDEVIANVTYPNGTLLQQLTNQATDFIFNSSNLTEIGRYNITVFANDTFGNTNTSESFFNVGDTIFPTWNQTPSSQTIEYNTDFSYQVNASDNYQIDKYFIDDTSNFIINPATGLITNNTLLDLGIYSLNISVNDTSNNINSSVINITVQDTTNPAWDQTPSNQNIEYNTLFSYDVNASDYLPDKYFLDDNINFTINSASGLITNNTKLNLITYTLNISVNDTSNNINSSLINITVQDTTAPVINISINDTVLLFENESVTIDFNASDYFLDSVIAN